MEEPASRLGRKRSEHARLAILSASLGLLRKIGYGELSTDAIAREAGVGKQTIYRWWASKGEVVLEALSEHARGIEVPATGSLRGDIAAFMGASFRLLRGVRGTGPVLRGLMAEAQLNSEFAPRFAKFIQTRRDALRQILLRHATDPAQADVAVDMLFGGLWYRLLIGHGPLDPLFAERLADVISAGVNVDQTREK